MNYDLKNKIGETSGTHTALLGLLLFEARVRYCFCACMAPCNSAACEIYAIRTVNLI